MILFRVQKRMVDMSMTDKLESMKSKLIEIAKEVCSADLGEIAGYLEDGAKVLELMASSMK